MLGVGKKIDQFFVETGKIRKIFVIVLNHEPFSSLASQGAYCAGEQSAFWRMHDALYERQDALWNPFSTVSVVKQFAASLKLDLKKFNSCLDSKLTLKDVRASDQRYRATRLYSQPWFNLNDRSLLTDQPWDKWKEFIDAELR